jgi:shikimate kinase
MDLRRPLVITGFMGCGKTALAISLAEHLGCELVDLDEAITLREKRSPAMIIEADGEAAFRLIETDALRQVLTDNSAGVISLGGGAWIVSANRELVSRHSGFTVWVDAPFEVCWQRITASGENRPLGRSREQAQALFDKRRPLYGLADCRLEAGKGATLDELTRQVESEVFNRMR